MQVLLQLKPDETNRREICLQSFIVLINKVSYDFTLSFTPLVCSETITLNRNLPCLSQIHIILKYNTMLRGIYMATPAKRMRYLLQNIPLIKRFDQNRPPLVGTRLPAHEAFFKRWIQMGNMKSHQT